MPESSRSIAEQVRIHAATILSFTEEQASNDMMLSDMTVSYIKVAMGMEHCSKATRAMTVGELIRRFEEAELELA